MEFLTEIVETIQNISGNYGEELGITDNNVNSNGTSLYHLNKGLKYFENGDSEAAEKEFLQSLLINKNSFEANFNFAIFLRDKQNYHSAIKYFANCSRINSQNFSVLFNIAFCNEKLHHYNTAIRFYMQAEKIYKDNSLLYFNLGNIYKQLKNWQSAKKNYYKSLQIEQGNVNVLLNLSSVYYYSGSFAEAISILKKVLELDPDNFSAKMNYAAALAEIGKFDEAVKMYNSLLQINYNDVELHYNLSVLLLLLGNFEQGFKEYEWRLKDKKKYNCYPEISFWQHEKLNGKKIVVIDEQGIGDAFQFVRYIKLLKNEGAKIIYSCRNSIIHFMSAALKKAGIADEIVPLNSQVNADYKVYLMSLPFKFLSEYKNFSVSSPYFNFDDNYDKNYKIETNKRKLNIGIVWKGNPEHEYDFKRSMNIKEFLNMLPENNVKIFSLQNDITNEEKEILNSNNIIDLSSKFESFIETAKIIGQLDLIISVDTATAHLSGALNKETFLLLSKVPDWRWGLNNERTELYTSVKIFRQSKLANWENVIKEVKSEVEKKTRNLSVKNAEDKVDLMNIKLKGLQALGQKNYEDAIKYLEIYLQNKNDDLETYFWLGCSYYDSNYLDKAEEIFLKLENTEIQSFETLSILGKLYLQKNNFSLSAEYYRKALNKKENNDLLNGIGVALQKQGKFNDASQYFKRAVSIYPNIAGNHLNYANNCYYSHKFDEAIEHFDKAIELENLASAHIGKSFALLSQKQFKMGFKEFEWSLTNFKPQNGCKAVKWNGQYAKDKKIFIYAEQGLGDAIQFSRFLPNVKEKGLHITMRCPGPLKNLFASNNYVDAFSDTILNDTDYYVSLINLPNVLGLGKEEDFVLPNQIFNISKSLINNWKLFLNKEKYNVGLVFNSKSSAATTNIRNVPFGFIETLSDNENVDFYLLQKEYEEKELKLFAEKYPNIKVINEDLLNVAAIIKNLDLVITMDSAVANLSGTLNKETWIMLPFVSDWRWEYAGEKSYWYPSVKLFRQTEFNNWETVIAEIKLNLDKKVRLFFEQNDSNSAEIDKIKTLLDKHDFDNAKTKIKSFLLKYPENTDANFLLGYIYQLQNNLEPAAACYSKTLSLKPAHFDALNNIGVVLKDLGKFEKAEEFLKFAQIINNDNSSVYNNLGIVNDLLGNFSKALLNFEKALSINGEYIEALLNYANTLQTLKQYDKAIHILDKLLSINSEHVGGNFNKSLTLLSMGNYQRGFELYEWRRRREDFLARNFSKPELTKQTIEGKTILVYDEQGLGDTIQFCRYVQLLKEKGAKVILQCHSALLDLLKGCKGADAVIARESLDEPNIEYDYHIPLLSLPKYFGTKLSTLPVSIPYINVSEHLCNKFRTKYFSNNKINAGIVWEGKTPVGNAHRACSLASFATVINNNNNFKFFSLQKGKAAVRDKQMMDEYGITDLSPELNTFNETAAMIKGLDLIITIDTSVAHLAGALGAETFTILSYKTDWRWQNGNGNSVWYPRMKLIRQKRFGNWENVFEKINFLLNKMKRISQNNHY